MNQLRLIIQQLITHLYALYDLYAADLVLLFRVRIPFVDHKTNRQSANFKTSQLTIQQRLLYGKQISHKILKNPKNFYTPSRGRKKPESSIVTLPQILDGFQ